MTDGNRHIMTAFAEALGYASSEERAAYLERACRDDPDARARVEELLRAHEAAGDFLRGPDAPAEPPAREGPGTVIGTYKLLEQIGEGGFGVVFMAEQLRPVRRKVALKVLKPGMDTRQVVARFEAERQALALMDHSNIARVFDGGETVSGRPYFVMELVRGVPATDFCDQNHLSVGDRLALFVSVCRAVQHAHQKGVIHRDLKPSNVLVTLHDGVPVAKVIDFGIAKATEQPLTDKTVFTNFAQIVGTPMYMSPEQAEMTGLDVDTRTDVYSLGVLLYELLTGTTPFANDRLRLAAYDEIRRIIREEEPVRPSARLSTLGAAAATVSANRRSDPKRLNRLVRGDLDWVVMKCLEKDRTRRYDTAEGLARDVERYLHDEPVRACPPSRWYRMRKFARRHQAGLVSAGSLVALLFVLCGGVGWVMWDRAAQRAKTVTEVEAALEEAARFRLEGKWGQGDAAAKRAEALLAHGVGTPELHAKVRSLLDDFRMVVRLDEARIRRSAVRDGRFDLEAEAQAFADAFRDYGVDVESLGVREAAERVKARTIRVELAAALDVWATTRRAVPRDGRKTWQDLLRVARAADPDPRRTALRDTVLRRDREALERWAATEDVHHLPPVTLVLLAAELARVGSVPDATAMLRRAQQQHPNDFWINHQLAYYLTSERSPNWDDAIRFYTAAVALRPDSPGARLNFGNALSGAGRHDEAVAAARKAIELKPDYAEAENNLGLALRKTGRLDEAVSAYHRAIRLKPKLFEPHNNLGHVMWNLGRLDEAAAAYRRVIELAPRYAEGHSNLGGVLADKGLVTEAEAACRRAIGLQPQLAQAHYHLGNALSNGGRLDDAIVAFRRAIELRSDLPEAHCNLGVALQRRGRSDEAIAAFRKATELKPRLVRAHHNLALTLESAGRYDDAIAAYRRVLELAPDSASAHYDLANTLRQSGRLDESAAAYRRAFEVKPDFAEAHCNFGHLLRQRGQFAEARAAFERGHELGSRRPDWRYPSARWLNECRLLAQLADTRPAVLRGDEPPADVAERLACALYRHDRHDYVAAARLMASALMADRNLTDDPKAGYRHDAACSAALAGCGRGADTDLISDEERRRWRAQALAWLRADLTAFELLLADGNPEQRRFVMQSLHGWQSRQELAGLREPSLVAKLSAGERDACRQLWDQVRAAIARANAAR